MVVEFGVVLSSVILHLYPRSIALELIGEKAIMRYFNKANSLWQALHIAITCLVITTTMGKLEQVPLLLKMFPHLLS